MNILQYLNQDAWIDLIINKFNCYFIEKSKFIFKNKYEILENPNMYFLKDKISVYWLPNGEINGVFNTKNNLIIIKISYIDGYFFEIENIHENKYELIPHPLIFRAEKNTNCIFY